MRSANLFNFNLFEMRKIRTIFKRGSNNKVIDELDVDFEFISAMPTEKLDGMNIRATVRSGELVRLEKRRNPTSVQKESGIIDPWYTDADANDSADQYLFDAVSNRFPDMLIPDGEWSGEAIGPKIQGNPLRLTKRTIVFFSLGEAPEFPGAPNTYNELKEWLPKQQSKFGNGPIEGIIWHRGEDMVKIKTKDF